MKIRRLFRTAYITGAAVFMLAAIARASTIEIDTGAAGAGTGFAGSISPLMLDSSTGDATLTFESTSGEFDSPTNIDLGDFVLGCVSCATTGASFAPFTFDLVLTDLTDNDATGEFLGASSGGTVTDDSSTITIAWSPSQLGPGTNNAMGSSDFGASEFTIDGSTGIVAPNSGNDPGESTIQGMLTAAPDPVPEPATLSLIGGGLISLGILRRKRLSRR